MNEKAFASALMLHAQAHGITLPADFAGKCLQHVRLMLDWNRRTNLTRITDPEEILARHILDSLLPSPWLPAAGRGADIGSGAGFPGVVLALARPELAMTLIESNRKKASFLTVLTTQLRLSNLNVLHGTWKDWLRTMSGRDLPRMDCITMRAVRLEKEHLTDLARNGLRPGGVFAYWGGPAEGVSESRIKEGWGSPGEMRMLEPIPYTLPCGMGEHRLLRWIREPEQAPLILSLVANFRPALSSQPPFPSHPPTR
ncbi:MAG: 16S rRNA (guanine(527)-N(7))-methyltransferase RsmG [Syntrophobacteraceae bacterium]